MATISKKSERTQAKIELQVALEEMQQKIRQDVTINKWNMKKLVESQTILKRKAAEIHQLMLSLDVL